MKYSTLIKRFQKYADEEVSIICTCRGEVIFFPISDGNNEIIALKAGEEEPFRAKEIKK